MAEKKTAKEVTTEQAQVPTMFKVTLPNGAIVECASKEELDNLLKPNEAEEELQSIIDSIDGDNLDGEVTIQVAKNGKTAQQTIRPLTLSDITDAPARCKARFAKFMATRQ